MSKIIDMFLTVSDIVSCFIVGVSTFVSIGMLVAGKTSGLAGFFVTFCFIISFLAAVIRVIMMLSNSGKKVFNKIKSTKSSIKERN